MANISPRPNGQSSASENATRAVVRKLASNVAEQRTRAGLTQLELAEAAELSRATINLIEAGVCDPRLSTITSLAEALGIDALRLLGELPSQSSTPARCTNPSK